MSKVLIIDNHINKPCHACSRFRKKIDAKYDVFRSKKIPKTDLSKYSHIVLTGGGGNLDKDNPAALHLQNLVQQAAKRHIPMLGICFGHELILASFVDSSIIEKYKKVEIGWYEITRTKAKSKILDGLPTKFYAFENHVRNAVELPKDFVKTAISDKCNIEAFEHKTLPIYGVQFHPETNPARAKKTLIRRLAQHLPKKWYKNTDDTDKYYDPELSRTIFRNFYQI